MNSHMTGAKPIVVRIITKSHDFPLVEASRTQNKVIIITSTRCEYIAILLLRSSSEA